MLSYIWFRFEWQFGVGAVVTMLLDVTRTIGTLMSIFLATLPLALFGVVLAISSSIFIAAPILLYLGEHRLRRPVATPEAEAEGAAAPAAAAP